jgi:hypothetical protein
MMIRLGRMGMIVSRIRVLSIHQHAGFLRRDAAAIYGLEDKGCAEVERGGGLLQEFRRGAGADERAQEHVSAETGKAFEMANAHGCFLYAAICAAQ